MYRQWCDKLSRGRAAASRSEKHSVFVNRSLQLEKIRFYGFDMDYTLANYKSPEFEALCFNLTRDVLIEYGYPEEFRKFNYESHFALRGLWFDKEYGTFTKNDQYGNILLAFIGFRFLSTHEIIKLYPNKFMKFDEKRIYVMNTLFNLPEMYLLAKVIDWFTHHPDYKISEKGVQKDLIFMSYQSIMQDVRDATDHIHVVGNLKKETASNLEKYVVKSTKLAFMLDRLRTEGRKTFLLTNSEYTYTTKIMNFILPEVNNNGVLRDWTTYFDYIVVDAKKPKFFINGSLLRAIDKETEKLIIGQHLGPLKTGHIYSGGSCEIFSRLIGSRGKDVLYVGDHIFGDILKSKKIVGWRTFLVIPELNNELNVWKQKQKDFQELLALDNQLEEIYKEMDIQSQNKPDVHTVKTATKDLATSIEAAYGTLGSIFRNGSRLTFFSSQIQRYADLYASSCFNLVHYPLCYMFRNQTMLLPHESNYGSNNKSENESKNYVYFCRTEKEVINSLSNEMTRPYSLVDDLSN